MKDDFLYQLRTEPPPHFAVQLKERLDRGSTRKVRVLRFGLGVLLFGTAFAIVSPPARLGVVEVIDWIRGVPAPATGMPNEVHRGLAGAFGDRKVDGAGAASEPVAISDATDHALAAENAAKAGAIALLEEMRAVRLQRSNPTSTTDVGADVGGVSNDGSSTSSGGDSTASPQSSFIVTGPLLAEDGTPAYVFDTRRAYFSVMSVCSDRLLDMLTRRAPFDTTTARTNAQRLELLASMMPEMFTADERGQTVPTRAEARIWSQPADFGAEIADFTAATRALSVSIGSRDAEQVTKQIAKVGLICASCHDQFRKGGNKAVGAVYP